MLNLLLHIPFANSPLHSVWEEI